MSLIPAWRDGVLRPVDKLAVHVEGLRHPAVSVFALRAGRILLQRRALTKYHTPGLWANTCCTHPHWGEAARDCADRRMGEELGLAGLDLRPAGRVEYRADVAGGMTEHEVVDIFTAELPEGREPAPNPAEVAATDWVTPAALMADLAARPERYTPWLRIYMADHRQMILGAGATV